jgi:hypothetical protein
MEDALYGPKMKSRRVRNRRGSLEVALDPLDRQRPASIRPLRVPARLVGCRMVCVVAGLIVGGVPPALTWRCLCRAPSDRSSPEPARPAAGRRSKGIVSCRRRWRTPGQRRCGVCRDHRRSFRSIRRSRATAPLKNVTIRSLPSRRVPTAKPGTRRSCRAPQSHSALQTSSGSASIVLSLLMNAI